MRTVLAVAAVTVAACAGLPPEPSWRADAHGSLQNFEIAYLEGHSKAAEGEFARARMTLSATGRADLVARAELVRCAARTASLDFDDCPGYQALAGDAPPAERAYAAYLAGKAQGADIALLPPQHHAVAAGGGSALTAIEDPFSRLVAAGVLFRQGRIAPADIALAVDTASRNGWRRPLLAWLGVQEKRAQDAGDREAAAAIRRRIRLVTGDR
ncbi:MAG: hypothetical protein IPP91_14390 [Betaproteobacteria bacterium]|nr:hypothetical protein [Betaproteobacteria bacterium]